MKINKTILLHIPTLFIQELNKYLKSNPPNFKYDVNYFYYIVHFIMDLQTKNKSRESDNHDEYVPINLAHLKSITISKIGNYIKLLNNGEFIMTDNQYIVGQKSKGYLINPVYCNKITAIEIQPGCKLFLQILKTERRKKAHNNRLPDFLKQMNNTFMKIDFDYCNAETWIQSQLDDKKRVSYSFALNQLKDDRFRYFKRNKTNQRLDTNLTNLKKDLKQFIVGDYVSIDLKNSQPFFLGMLLNEIIKQEGIGQIPLCCSMVGFNLVETFGIKRVKAISLIHQKDKKAFLVNLTSFTSSVVHGSLYDDFVKSYNDGIPRDEVKDIMFKVLFSKNETNDKYKIFIPYEKEKEVFASVYPFVYRSVKALKSKDNVLLPVFLQKIESYIFIDCIAKKLVNEGIVPLTIHDSLIVKLDQKERTTEIINRIFLEKFNVIPAFEIKPLKKGSFQEIH